MDKKLTQKQFDILEFMTEHETVATQRKIAQETTMSVGSVNKTIAEFAELGYVANGLVTDSGRDALEPYRVQRAVFIAAGFGSRLVPITLNTPKPLVRVKGKRIIDSLLDAVAAVGISEVYIVRGYLGEQFDQLLYKYPNIKFIENPAYNEANNISSSLCVRYLLQEAYVFEADLLLYNPKLIKKYQYETNFLGFPVDVTDDWCFQCDSDGVIVKQAVGGVNCYQMVGISYWDREDGAKLADDINLVYRSPGGKERYWEQVPLCYAKDHYRVHIRRCMPEDIVEIDTFSELKALDKTYDI